MVRRYDESIHVQAARADTGRGAAVEHLARECPDEEVPVVFLWRGRLYVVREVLERWRERRAWWQSAAADAVHGDPPAPAGGDSPGLEPLGLSVERRVWRVEAKAGRESRPGVYDLCLDGSTGGEHPDEGWRLLRVAD